MASEGSRRGGAASPGDSPARSAEDAGWWPAAQRCASPNADERPPGTEVTLALLHSISLPPGVYGGDAIERLFRNTLDWDAHPYFQAIRGLRVSAHVLIRRDGAAVQFVDARRRAWHAGRSVWAGRDRCNDYAVGIELEGLEGACFDDRQYATLVDALGWLRRHHPITAVAGHEHVAAGRKHDPGPGFEWQRLRSSLAGAPLVFAG